VLTREYTDVGESRAVRFCMFVIRAVCMDGIFCKGVEGVLGENTLKSTYERVRAKDV